MILILFSCQKSEGPSGNVIVYADAVGTFDGVCADYDASTGTQSNSESAIITLYAINQSSVGVNTTCVRFDDYEMNVKSTSAEKITFEKSISSTSTIVLNYYAQADSLSLTKLNNGEGDLIFVGIKR